MNGEAARLETGMAVEPGHAAAAAARNMFADGAGAEAAIGSPAVESAIDKDGSSWRRSSGFWGTLRDVLAQDRARTHARDMRHSALLVFAIRVGSAGLLFGSQILLARWMGAADYGIYVSLWTAVLVVGGLSHLGLNMTMMRLVPHYVAEGALAELRGLLKGGRLFAVASGMAIAAIGALVVWSGIIGAGAGVEIPLLLALACLPVYGLTEVQDGIGRGQSWTVAGLMPPYLLRPAIVLMLVASAHALSVPASVGLAMGAAVIATWLAAVVQSALIAVRVRECVEEGPAKYRFGGWLGMSLPLLAVGACELALQNTDVLMLNAFCPPSEIGAYYAAAKTTTLALFVHYAVGSAYAGRIATAGALRDQVSLRHLVSQAVKWTFWPSLAIVAIVLALGRPLLSLFGPGFVEAYPVMAALSVGIMARAATGPSEIVLNMLGQQRACAWAFASAAVVCIVANALLIPLMGPLGAAVATAAAFSTAALLNWSYARRLLDLDVFIFGRTSDGLRPMTTLLKDCCAALAPLRAAGAPAALPTSSVKSNSSEPVSGLALETIEDVSSLEGVRDDWEDLFRRAGQSNQLFQAFDWNLTWARHYLKPEGDRSGPRLAVATGRRDGKLVLVWPLVRQHLTGLDHLMWISEPVSQYGDILVDPSAVTEADLASSWDFVRQSFVPDVVLLRKVRDDAAVGRIMDAIGAASSASQLAPYLDLASAPDFDTYETRYSGKARKNRRRLRRRLEEKGRVSFVHLAHGAAAAALARKGVAMKRTWLEAREMIAPAVGDARFEAFFSDFAGEARNGARCRVSAIELDGQPIAVMVALGWAGRLAGHVFAYDIEHEKIGAGVLLLEEVARQALADGYEVLDLLAPADAYKLDWSDSSAMTRDWSISLTLTGGVYRSVYLERLRGPLKRSAAALPPLVRKLVRFGLDRRQRAAGSHSGIK